MPTVTLNQYAEILRRLIEKPSSHILLNAREMARTLGGDTKGVAFELASGRFQKEFITLWELFDQREDFKVFVKMFAEKAKEIRRLTSFTVIVTSTATAKHVVEHVHAAIETDRDKVAVHYLGDYPFLNLESRNLLDFKNDRVLIVTDVIASGNLAKKMVEIVEEVGGKPVGVLCVVVTSRKLIDDPFLEYGKSTRKRVHIHTLTTRPIRSLKPAEIAKLTNIIKIDPNHDFPEEGGYRFERVPSAIQHGGDICPPRVRRRARFQFLSMGFQEIYDRGSYRAPPAASQEKDLARDPG